MSNRYGRRMQPGTEAGDADLTRRSLLARAGALAGVAAIPGVLAACGSSSSGSSSSSSSASSSSGSAQRAALTKNGTTRSSFKPYDPSVPAGPPTGLPKKVATNFPLAGYFDDFSQNVQKATSDRGFAFASTQWQTDVAQNLAQLQQLQQTGVGAVVAQVQDEHGESATLLIISSTNGTRVASSVADLRRRTSHPLSDQHRAGVRAGPAGGERTERTLARPRSVIFNDNETASALIPRGQGRVDGVKTAGGNVQIVANQPIKLLTAQEGFQFAQTILQAHPGANVWLGDDDTSLGVVSALESAGKTPACSKIYVSGFNGQRNALEAVKKGGLFREDMGFPNAV